MILETERYAYEAAHAFFPPLPIAVTMRSLSLRSTPRFRLKKRSGCQAKRGGYIYRHSSVVR